MSNQSTVAQTMVTATAPVTGLTIAQAYLQRIELSADHPVYYVRRAGAYQPYHWKELHERVLSIIEFYNARGVKAGDRVCIVSQTRPEWNIVDIANLCLGVITVPIYHSSSQEDTTYILEHCEATMIFVEDGAQLEKVKLALGSRRLPLVIFANEEQPDTLKFQELKASDRQRCTNQLRESAGAITPSHMATIVYTSGTTGTPKGAVLTHQNLMAEVQGVMSAVHLLSDDRSLAFLPFAHILGRVESLLPIVTGLQLCFAESINSVPQNIQEVKPTILVSVPRIYEKIFAKIQSEVSAAPAVKRAIFNWSVGVGRQVARLRADQKPVPLWLSGRYAVADKLVFEKIRTKLGGSLRFAVSGGAPLSPDLAEFFLGCGVTILEGYGLTETTAAVTCNRPEELCLGTVGKPIQGTSIRIAADGEIQLKGTLVFKEYYKNPAATKEAFTDDGWFCTGDIGEFNTRGFLKITDRKKELIVTSGGKNIAPQKLENLLKGCQYVSNAMVYGDKQKFLVVLITPNEPELKKWGVSKNISAPFAELLERPETLALYEEALRTTNATLASYESIKRFKLIPVDFTVETGELTPSLKIKRKIIVSKYRSEIEEMYLRS